MPDRAKYPVNSTLMYMFVAEDSVSPCGSVIENLLLPDVYVEAAQPPCVYSIVASYHVPSDAHCTLTLLMLLDKARFNTNVVKAAVACIFIMRYWRLPVNVGIGGEYVGLRIDPEEV